MIRAEDLLAQDKNLAVELISQTPNPQQSIYLALHQCYSEEPVMWEQQSRPIPSEEECGEIIIRSLLSGERGHWGPMENTSIMVNVVGFPHTTMQQLRTHRTGVTFDVQSGRYTGERIIGVARGVRRVEDVFYIRPCGEYIDRSGKKFVFTPMLRNMYIDKFQEDSRRYAALVEDNCPYEMARDLEICYSVRQHFTFSVNPRSLCHILDLRAKKDAELEIQALCILLMEKFAQFSPAIASWYKENRWGKAKLSP